ncbi:MAG: MurR/RpiR family transcriptional regulator [Anaerolineae bacterium]
MILDRIRQFYPQLTKSQRRLADYIVAHYREAAFLTASRLAHTLEVNEATVVRFAQRLGYDGYPEMAQGIQQVVREELRVREDSPEEALVSVLGRETEALQRAVRHVSPQVAREARQMLQVCRTIFVVGQGTSACLARMMSDMLRSAGLASEAPPADPSILALALERVDEQCLVIGISADLDSLETANVLVLAKQKGARTLALTESAVAACAQVADLALVCPGDDSFLLPSVGVLGATIDALVQTCASDARDSVLVRVRSLAEVREAITARRKR